MATDCPDDDTLALFVGRKLPEAQRAKVELHCEKCPSCGGLVTHLVEAFAESLLGPLEPLEGLPALGTTLGRYVILEWVGAGAMGAVYSAYDPQLDRRVALKILPPARGDQAQQLRARFLGEAQAMASISDPNVIAVHDVGIHEGLAFFAMELVEGDTLEGWLAAEVRTTDALVHVFAAAGRGLAAAHHNGLVHRDFKPRNVLVGNDGRVRVIDFGLARFATEESEGQEHQQQVATEDWARARTRTGALVGTPAYMAPEQLRASQSDASSDQFAFCVSLYEALFGQRPFEGSTVSELTASIELGPPRVPSDRRGVPRRLRRLLSRGLAAEAGDRYASMSELLDELSLRPWARWGVVSASALVVIGSALAAHGLSTAPDTPSCLSNAEHLTGVWDSTRRESLLDVVPSDVARGSAEFASVHWLVGRFDNYSRHWLKLHHDVCVATVERREQSASMMDAKMACLGRAREQLRANVEQAIESGTSVVAHVSTLQVLPDLAACDDASALATGPAPPPPEQSAAVEAQRRKLADSRAMSAIGNYRGGTALAREVDFVAVTLDYPPLRDEAALRLGRAARQLNSEEAVATSALDRALRGSLSTHNWSIALRAATSRACLSAVTHNQPNAGLAYGRIAIGLAEEPSTERSLVAKAHRCMGAAQLAARALDKAEHHHRRAVSVSQEGPQPNELSLAWAHAELGRTLVVRGKAVEALVELRRARDTFVDLLGVGHPDSMLVRAEIGTVLADIGEYDDAEAEFQRVIDFLSQRVPPDRTNIGVLHAKRGNLFVDRERYDEATTAFETARSILAEVMGAEHPDVLRIDSSLANVLLAQGRPEAARTVFTAVLDKRDAVVFEGHPLFVSVAISLADLEFELENAPRAILRLREVTSQCDDQTTIPTYECGRAHLVLARGLLDHGDREGAAQALTTSRPWLPDHPDPGIEDYVSAIERDLGISEADTGTSN